MNSWNELKLVSFEPEKNEAMKDLADQLRAG